MSNAQPTNTARIVLDALEQAGLSSSQAVKVAAAYRQHRGQSLSVTVVKEAHARISIDPNVRSIPAVLAKDLGSKPRKNLLAQVEANDLTESQRIFRASYNLGRTLIVQTQSQREDGRDEFPAWLEALYDAWNEGSEYQVIGNLALQCGADDRGDYLRDESIPAQTIETILTQASARRTNTRRGLEARRSASPFGQPTEKTIWNQAPADWIAPASIL